MIFDFQFKKFGIQHSESTMKVGTDAILLGALVELEKSDSVLEIGTGCGIISLMLAQRFSCRIEAIEIDQRSAMQAAQNISHSPWNEIINVIYGDVNTYEFEEKFSTIVSNPPYFQAGLLCDDAQKSIARHAHSLNFRELCKVSHKLLNENGCLWVILPKASCEIFENESRKHGFYCERKVLIQNSPQQKVSLIVSKWAKKEVALSIQDLVIRNNDGTYSDKYCNLTCHFHPFL